VSSYQQDEDLPGIYCQISAYAADFFEHD